MKSVPEHIQNEYAKAVKKGKKKAEKILKDHNTLLDNFFGL